MPTPAASPPIGQVVQPDFSQPAQTRQAFVQVATALRGQTLEASVVAGDEAANVRRFTFQIVDRERKPVQGRHPVLLLIALTQSAAPTNSQTVAMVTGTLLASHIANAALLILPDASGLIVIDVTIAGAATRWVTPIVLGRGTEAGPFTWAA